MSLLLPVRPPSRPGIDLRCCDCAEMLASLDGPADLVIADPPWTYGTGLRGDDDATTGRPDDYYAVLSIEQIRAHLTPGPWVASRLALWITWPILPEWTTPDGWRQVTGGAWVKSEPGDRGHYGPGFHWSGCSEPVIVYACGANAPNDRAIPVRNAWIEAPGLHSRKPARWMAQWIRRWVEPGGLVVDPYAGLGSVAEAVIPRGRGAPVHRLRDRPGAARGGACAERAGPGRLVTSPALQGRQSFPGATAHPEPLAGVAAPAGGSSLVVVGVGVAGWWIPIDLDWIEQTLTEVRSTGASAPRGLALMYLRWLESRGPMPTQPDIREALGDAWTEKRLRGLLATDWHAPQKKERADEGRSEGGARAEEGRNQNERTGHIQETGRTKGGRRADEGRTKGGNGALPLQIVTPTETPTPTVSEAAPAPPSPKPKPPRKGKPPISPHAKPLSNAFGAVYQQRYGHRYPWAIPGPDGALVEQWAVRLGIGAETEHGLIAAAVREIEDAAARYFDAVDAGTAFPKGEPASLFHFTRDLPRWLVASRKPASTSHFAALAEMYHRETEVIDG